MTPAPPIRRLGMALGRQMTVEYYGCNSGILADAGRMERIFLDAAHRSGATVICSRFHAFEPQGVSGMVIISESHFAVHAWPEHDYAAADIFTCGDSIDFDVAVDALRVGMESQQMIVSSVMHRGIVDAQGVERLETVCEDHSCRYALSWRALFDQARAGGISVAVDLYGCSALDGGGARRVAELLSDRLDLGRVGAAHVRRCGGELLSMRSDFDCGLLNGFLDVASGIAYLNFFCRRFVEPRTVADLALTAFAGHHYRTQVAIRQ